MTAAENAQPSWAGLGWNLDTPYLERRYNGCSDDGGDTGDLCWAGEQLMLSLEGTSSELVKDKAAGGDVWRAKQDPGWRVERFKDAANGDNDGEYWVVSTPQGMTFTFGRGKQATTGTATDSVFTVPVFGDDDGEPCHQSSVEDSWCTQAWRWNLDGVVDAHGNSTTYFYEQEKNKYARNGESGKSTEYVRGGHVRDIVYSQRVRRGGYDGAGSAALHHRAALHRGGRRLRHLPGLRQGPRVVLPGRAAGPALHRELHRRRAEVADLLHRQAAALGDRAAQRGRQLRRRRPGRLHLLVPEAVRRDQRLALA